MLKLSARKVRTAKGTQIVWYITGTCQFTGDKFRASTRCHRKSDAEVVLTATIERQRQKALLGPAAGTRPFGDAVQHYLAMGGEARFLTPLVKAFGDTPMREIENTDLSAQAALAYPGRSDATLVRQWYVPFIAVYNCGVDAGLAPPKKFTKPKVASKDVDYPGDDWLIKVVAACTRMEQRAAILFMSFSSLRASEVVRIRQRDYDPVAARVTVFKTKGPKGKPTSRNIALPPFVNEVLKLLPRDRPSALLFGYASRFSLTRILRRACKRAKVEYFSPHKAGRHAFAARFLKDGNSLKALMEAGGWRSFSSVLRYAHLEAKMVDKAVAGVSTPLSTPDVVGTLTGTVASSGVKKRKHKEKKKPKPHKALIDGAASED